MKKLLSCTILAALAAGPALAEHPGHHGDDGKGGRFFEKADANGDGAVSKEEFMASAEERFSKMDANGDGTFSKEEAEAAKAEWMEKMKERREKHREGKAEAQ